MTLDIHPGPGPYSTRVVFQTTADRDEFINLAFPGRKMGVDAPGHYVLPDGRTLHVFCNDIVVIR